MESDKSQGQNKQTGPVSLKSNKEGKNKLTSIMAILLLLVSGLCVYLFIQVQSLQDQVGSKDIKIDTLEVEKNDLQSELTTMIAQYDTMMVQNNTLSVELQEERDKLIALLEETKKVKQANAWEIHSLKKKLDDLRGIMKEYLGTIDSLNTLNKTLVAENQVVKQNLQSQENKNVELKTLNSGLEEKVRVGSRLEAMDLMTTAQRVKSNNTHRETGKADKADKIKCSFTLSANEIAKAENKKLYLRIMTPDGKILNLGQDEDHLFEFEGVKGLYSLVRDVEYKNKEVDMQVYWDVKDKLIPGEYEISVYCDALLIGKSKMTLK